METPRRRALGKGLEELFSSEVLDFDTLEEQIITETPKEEIVEIKLDELRSNPYQPRKVFEQASLDELAESIKNYGVFQPIIVKKSIKGYEIIAGERRVRASKIAMKETIPAIVREFDDNKMMEIALLENLQREDLNAIEEAVAYTKIMQAKGLTQDELAKIIGKSQGTINNTMGLLRLPEKVKNMVIKGELSPTHARILSKMSDYEMIEKIANKVVDEGLNVRELEEISKGNDITKRVKVNRKIKESDMQYKYIEDLLIEKLNAKVRVYKNKMEIKYSDINELNDILDKMNIGK